MKAQICISFNGCGQFAKDLNTSRIGGDLCDLLITSYDSFGIHAMLSTHVAFSSELEANGWAEDYAETLISDAYKNLYDGANLPIMDVSAGLIELEY